MNEKILLKDHGLKATPSRLSILHYLSTLDAPITAEELFRRLQSQGLDLSTLYRNLNTFVEAGLAKREVGHHKENIYSLIQEEERHFLVCLRCQKKIRLEGCPYHEVNEAIESQTGFRVLDHNTEIYGICPNCQRQEP
ncbi:MAG: transcriptional repressor [Bacilli bacterium]|nr:transcriptional repressor [Bacilli bacterium]